MPTKFAGHTQTFCEQVPPLKQGFGLLHKGIGVSQNWPVQSLTQKQKYPDIKPNYLFVFNC